METPLSQAGCNRGTKVVRAFIAGSRMSRTILPHFPDIRKQATLRLRCESPQCENGLVKFLVIEDTRLTKELRGAGFSVDMAAAGEAIERICSGAYDLLVMSDAQSGLLRAFGRRGLGVPVLVLGEAERAGRRLTIRLRAWRRLIARARAKTRISAGGVTLDLGRRVAERGGKRIVLQPNEAALLEILMKRPGTPITKEEILRRVWGYRFDPRTNVVDVLVYRLRSKIDRDFDSKAIVTVRGEGYLFKTGLHAC